MGNFYEVLDEDSLIINRLTNYKLKKALIDIEKLIKEKYKVELNNKTKIYKSTESVEFLGFRYASKNGNIVKKLILKTKMNHLNKKLKDNEIKFSDYRAVRDSYKGHLANGDCYNLYHKYIKNRK